MNIISMEEELIITIHPESIMWSHAPILATPPNKPAPDSTAGKLHYGQTRVSNEESPRANESQVTCFSFVCWPLYIQFVMFAPSSGQFD